MRRWQLWVGLAISLFFLVWALRQVSSFSEVVAVLPRADYSLVALALIAYFTGVWFRTIRWKYLLTPLKSMSVGKLFPVVVIGYMANDVLPLRMGELVRAYILHEREDISKSSSLATIFLERMFDGVTLLLFAVIVSLFIPLNDELQGKVRIAAAIFGVAIIAFLIAAFSPSKANTVIDVLLQYLPANLRPRLSKIAASFIDGLQALQQGRLLVSVLALSAVAWMCEAGMYYIIGVGFKLFQPFHVFLLTTVVANIGTMIPSSPGYVGTFEALSVFTLGLFQVNPDLAMSYTLVLHVALLVPITLLGFFYLWQHQLSLTFIGKQSAVGESNLKEEISG